MKIVAQISSLQDPIASVGSETVLKSSEYVKFNN